MDRFRQVLTQISEQYAKMGASQKLLLASLAVIATMTLFLVSQYAAKPSMVDLVPAGGEVDTVGILQSAGYNAEIVDGKVVVPQGQQRAAVSYLTQSGQLPGDTTLLFSNLIGSQDWKASSAQHRQQYFIALQNELSAIIGDFRSVSKASVILDVPQTTGLGRAARPATASVTVFTSGIGGVPQDMVDAVANLVSGAVSGLVPSGVKVIDGSTGRARTTSDDSMTASGRYLEYAAQVEKHARVKIEELFGHIPNVIVSVTAHVDITSVQSTENLYAPKDEGTVSLLKSETKNDTSSQQASRGAEAGVRSNQAVAINSGGGSGTSTQTGSTDTAFDTAIGSRTKTTLDPRGMPTHYSASVIIPQEYIVSIIEGSRTVDEGAEPEPVTAEEARAFFDQSKPMFEELVRPHLLGQTADGQRAPGDLSLQMAPLGAMYVAGSVSTGGGMLGTLTGGGGMLSGGRIIETVLIGILAAISLAMMLTMVKRSAKRIELPTVEELVGVTPQIEGNDELIGEAGEGEQVMAGIEVDEKLVEIQQLREQVSELVGQDPESAAMLIDRWTEQSEQS
jgi:flagellar biosynthesis/type III secretory pathway M-ring protein FliF/YscJ